MQTTCIDTITRNSQYKEGIMCYTTVTPSSGQDDATQKPNASICDHCREVALHPNRGHEYMGLTTIRKLCFGKEEAMSACNVDKSDRYAPLGIFFAALRGEHYNEYHSITT